MSVYELLIRREEEDQFFTMPWDEDPRVDVWAYTRGEKLPSGHVVALRVSREGQRRDFCQTAHGVPIVTSRVADLLQDQEHLNQFIQVIPTDLPGAFVLNVLSILDCIDVEASGGYMSFGPQGRELQGIRQVAIKRQADYPPLFRLEGWETPLLLLSSVRETLEASDCSGISFRETKIVG